MVLEPRSGFASAGWAAKSAPPTELFITGSSKKAKVCDAKVAAEVNKRVITPTKPSSTAEVSTFGLQIFGSAGIAGPGSVVAVGLGAGAGVVGATPVVVKFRIVPLAVVPALNAMALK